MPRDAELDELSGEEEAEVEKISVPTERVRFTLAKFETVARALVCEVRRTRERERVDDAIKKLLNLDGFTDLALCIVRDFVVLVTSLNTGHTKRHPLSLYGELKTQTEAVSIARWYEASFLFAVRVLQRRGVKKKLVLASALWMASRGKRTEEALAVVQLVLQGEKEARDGKWLELVTRRELIDMTIAVLKRNKTR